MFVPFDRHTKKKKQQATLCCNIWNNNKFLLKLNLLKSDTYNENANEHFKL